MEHHNGPSTMFQDFQVYGLPKPKTLTPNILMQPYKPQAQVRA